MFVHGASLYVSTCAKDPHTDTDAVRVRVEYPYESTDASRVVDVASSLGIRSLATSISPLTHPNSSYVTIQSYFHLTLPYWTAKINSQTRPNRRTLNGISETIFEQKYADVEYIPLATSRWKRSRSSGTTNQTLKTRLFLIRVRYAKTKVKTRYSHLCTMSLRMCVFPVLVMCVSVCVCVVVVVSMRVGVVCVCDVFVCCCGCCLYLCVLSVECVCVCVVRV